MDRPEPSESDSSSSGDVPALQVGKEDDGESIEQVNRITTLRDEEIAENSIHENEEKRTYQITEATALSLSDKISPIIMDLNPPTADSTLVNLHSLAEIAIDDGLKYCKGFDKPCLPTKHVMKENPNKTDLAALGVDLNDSFYPYKKLGHVRSTVASECGSTIGQMEISESMRRWKEMKQNGFLSTVEVKAPIHRLKRRQSRKNNDKEMKNMIDMTKQELNKHASVADPTQFLSGLNPGIIKHVRNSRQVNSIIKAMLQTEMRPLKREGKEEAINMPLIPCCRSKKLFSDSDTAKLKLNHGSYNNKTSEFNSECDDDDDDLTLKLSYSVTIAPEQAGKTTNADSSTNQEDITSLSVKAAAVALQWLKLIQHDITARQAAIQRSKNRVKNAIEMELPYLFSRDLHPKQENEPSFLIRRAQKEIFNVHLARWKAVFTEMKVSLAEAENQLEMWLRQVEELKSQCQEGLSYVSTKGFLHLDAAKELRISKSQEAYEREFAVRAAAASIYSTSNMIMATENRPCF